MTSLMSLTMSDEDWWVFLFTMSKIRNETLYVFIITTVKPNIRVPQARGRFTPWMRKNGFIGVNFILSIIFVLVIQLCRDMCHTQSTYTSTHYYSTNMHRQVMDTNYTTFPLGAAGIPQVTLPESNACKLVKYASKFRKCIYCGMTFT